MENVQRFWQNTYKKKEFWSKYNEECIEVSAKYIQKKVFWAKYNGECVEVSAKYIPKKTF